MTSLGLTVAISSLVATIAHFYTRQAMLASHREEDELIDSGAMLASVTSTKARATSYKLRATSHT